MTWDIYYNSQFSAIVGRGYPAEVRNMWLGTYTITVNVLDIFGDGSCIALYQLDGNANDTGGAYNGTPYNISYASGRFGQCASFNGSNSYISMGNWLSTVATSGQLSFSYWEKKTSTSDQTVWSTNSLTQANTVLISASNVQYWDKNRTHYGIDYPNYSDGNWHHYVIIVDTINSKLILYKDSSVIQELTFAAGSSILNSSDMSLGRRSGGSYYFNGHLDQVRIFKKALSATEITQLYNEQG